MRVRPLLSFLLAAWVAGVTPATADESATALDRFQLFDMDGDGTTEIRSLTRLLAVGHQGPLVVVFVEPRLLEPLEGAEPLRPRLDRLLGDLADEGCRTWLVAADLEPGANHRDGQYRGLGARPGGAEHRTGDEHAGRGTDARPGYESARGTDR